METPSSMRRVTRSQTSIASQKSKQESRTTGNPDRSALLDITNDSPIIGLAMGSLAEKTPSSLVAKNQVRAKKTPGSGEALLRGQVKTLLQKVEEEAELVNKISFEHRPPFRVLLGIPHSSPGQLLAPTPANTPQILSHSGFEEEVLMSTLMTSIKEDQDSKAMPAEAAETLQQDEALGPHECLINRALLFDSPGKSEASEASTISSSLTYQGSTTDKNPDDDNSSAWSIQVNVSTQDDDEEEVDDFEEEEKEGKEEEEEEEGEEDGESFNDLCEGLRKMSVRDDTARLPEFTGKHTRFVYNSDDEMEGEEEVSKRAASPNVLLLKGLPVPEGKHLRFQDEEEE